MKYEIAIRQGHGEGWLGYVFKIEGDEKYMYDGILAKSRKELVDHIKSEYGVELTESLFSFALDSGPT